MFEPNLLKSKTQIKDLKGRLQVLSDKLNYLEVEKRRLNELLDVKDCLLKLISSKKDTQPCDLSGRSFVSIRENTLETEKLRLTKQSSFSNFLS